MDVRREDYFAEFMKLEDPRIERHKKHELFDILVIAILAVIANADDWVSIERYGHTKLDWLKGFLNLKHGIPSHDTFRRVFSLMSPQKFTSCFVNWISEVFGNENPKIIAIDGKTIRGSRSKKSNLKALHIVSAWCAENQTILGQLKTEEKSNEITAIPSLLETIDVKGATVTIDAMGCQKEIATKIIDGKGAYILSLKGNQGNLHEDVKLSFDDADPKILSSRIGASHTTVDGDHGRVEEREHWVATDLDGFSAMGWKNLSAVGIVNRSRFVDGKTSVERCYFLLSEKLTPQEFSRKIRLHWSIENQLHWSLDVSFSEDKCKIRDRNGGQNFSSLRKIALSLLKKIQTKGNVGVKTKRLMAGWDNQFLENVMAESIDPPKVKKS